jgi:hypothetical protein
MSRIRTSFVDAPRRTHLVLLTAWGLAVGCMGLAAWFAVDAMATREGLPILTRRLSNLEREHRLLSAGTSRSLPAAADLRAMRSRVSRLNTVSIVRGWSSAEVLSWLESHMSADVRLVSFHHKAREAEVLLVAEADNAAVLTAFLSGLEREPRFAEVLLSKQASRTQQNGQSVQFEIKVRLKA